MEILLVLVAGIGVGWIASWFLVVRPERDTVRDMRYQGFVHDKPIPPKKKAKTLEVNET